MAGLQAAAGAARARAGTWGEPAPMPDAVTLARLEAMMGKVLALAADPKDALARADRPLRPSTAPRSCSRAHTTARCGGSRWRGSWCHPAPPRPVAKPPSRGPRRAPARTAPRSPAGSGGGNWRRCRGREPWVARSRLRLHPIRGLAIAVQLDTGEAHHSNVPATTAHNSLVARRPCEQGGDDGRSHLQGR